MPQAQSAEGRPGFAPHATMWYHGSMKDNLQIPYGIFDFKRIRREGYCHIDKTGYIPLLEQAGSFLFFTKGSGR